MSRQQAAALMIANAVVSLIISLTVVLIFERSRSAELGQPVAAQEGPAAVSAADQPATPVVATEPAGPTIVATYVVKSGDSLGSIAFRHGVSLDALMRANNIDDANYITAGQSLLIPEGGEVPAVTATPRPVPTIPAVLTPEGGQTPVTIEALHSTGEVQDEYVTLVNRGAQGVALEGWALEDEDGHTYTFPALFLWRSGTVLVHTGAGTDSATDLYWGLADGVWDRVGEKATLRDAAGNVVSQFEVKDGGGG